MNDLLESSGAVVSADDVPLLTGPALFNRFVARRDVTDQDIERVVDDWLHLRGHQTGRSATP